MNAEEARRLAREDYAAALVAEVVAERNKLRVLIREVIGGDWTDSAYAAELPSRLAESGWFKRARAALTS